jgi:hypothetical protein
VNGRGPSGASGGPDNYTSVKAYSATTQNGIKITLPPKAVAYIMVNKK